MALSVDTNFNIFDDISATPYSFGIGVITLMLAFYNPASPHSNWQSGWSSRSFLVTYRLQRRPVHRRRNTQSQRTQRSSSFKPCWHHPEILVRSPNAIGGLPYSLAGRIFN
jgi:hypothetical protein